MEQADLRAFADQIVDRLSHQLNEGPEVPRVLTENQAADYVRMSRNWLRKARMASYRSEIEAPPYVRIGGAIRYLRADLDAWLERCRVS